MKKRSKILLAALFAVCSVSLLTAATCTSSHTHTYGDVVWAWSNDGTSAQASVSCSDGDDTLTADATVKQTDYTDPTCTEAGTITYTATVTLNGVSYTSVKTVEGEAATGHKTVTHSGGVAATLISAGSSEYWYCADCGNYYSDSACTKELESADLPALASVYDSIYAGLSSTGSVAEGTELFNGFITTTGSVYWYNSISSDLEYSNRLVSDYDFTGRLYLSGSSSGLTFTLSSKATITVYASLTNYTLYIKSGSTASGSNAAQFTATTAQRNTIAAYETDLAAGTYTICTSDGSTNIFAIMLEGSGYTEGLVNYSENTSGGSELEDNQFNLVNGTEYTFTATQSGYHTFSVSEDLSSCIIWKSESDGTSSDYTVSPYLDVNDGSHSFEVYIESGSSITLYLTGADSAVVTYTVSDTQSATDITTDVPSALQEGDNEISLSAEDAESGVSSTFTASVADTYLFSTEDYNAWITVGGDSLSGNRVNSYTTYSVTLFAGESVTVYFYGYYNDTSAQYTLNISQHTHTYGTTPVWSWSEDYSAATATFSCTSGDDDQQVTATVTSETTAATCTENGKIVYTATATFDGTEYTGTKTVVIPATNHTYGDAVWTWSEDNSTTTVSFACTSGDDTQTFDAKVTSETTAATCTAEGKTVYTATATFEDKEYTETKTVVLGMLKHTLEHHDAVAATESTAGNKEYWQCSVCNKYFTDAEGTTEVTYNDVVIEILNHTHSYDNDNISWSWSEDYSYATATLSCDKGDNDLVGTATVTSETTAATCTADGKIVYTATVTLNEKAYTDTQTVTLAATGHTYGEPAWNWAEDYSSATATFTCTAGDDTQTVTAEVTSSTTAATCTKDGEIAYTATVTFDGTEYTNTQSAAIPATGHTYGEPSWTWGGDYTTATATFTCTAGDDTQTVTAEVTSSTTAATCTKDGEIAYTATVTFDGTEYTETRTVGSFVLNAGNESSANDYIFTAPVGGTYTFTLTGSYTSASVWAGYEDYTSGYSATYLDVRGDGSDSFSLYIAEGKTITLYLNNDTALTIIWSVLEGEDPTKTLTLGENEITASSSYTSCRFIADKDGYYTFTVEAGSNAYVYISGTTINGSDSSSKLTYTLYCSADTELSISCGVYGSATMATYTLKIAYSAYAPTTSLTLDTTTTLSLYDNYDNASYSAYLTYSTAGTYTLKFTFTGYFSYYLDSYTVSVGGTEVTGTNDSYTFTIDGGETIVVTFTYSESYFINYITYAAVTLSEGGYTAITTNVTSSTVFVIGTNEIKLGAEVGTAGITTTYTAQKDGIYTFSVDSGKDNYVTVGGTLYLYGSTVTGSYIITAGTEIKIKVRTYSNGEGEFNLYIGYSEIEYQSLTLDKAEPLSLYANIESSGKHYVYLSYTAESAGDYNLTLDSSYPYSLTIATTLNGVTVSGSEGIFNLSLAKGENLIVLTYSIGSSVANNYTFSATLAEGKSTVIVTSLPDTSNGLPTGTNTVTLSASSASSWERIYVGISASEAGTYTISVDAGDEAAEVGIAIYNAEWVEVLSETTISGSGTTSYDVTLESGYYLYLYFYSATGSACEYNLYITAK